MKLHNAPVTRRRALGLIGGAVSAAAAVGTSAAPQRRDVQAAGGEAGEFLLRGGHVLTIDDGLGELRRGDVHIRQGLIAAVAEQIDAPRATAIDATGMIVMPGFIDTHWHMWNSVWRGMANDASEYFRLQRLATHYTPEDHYTAVLYAGCEAISAGFTTCHNWAHGVRSYADVEAEMRALSVLGLRARMGYMGVIAGTPTSADDLRRGWRGSLPTGRAG